MKNIEILAPAGSIETLYAALKMGADAVYTGTERFGARAFADNPSVEEIERALTYAHLRNKKIYLTVNTLLTDRELEGELYPLIKPLYEAGLDACIVQDVGVLSFLHENFPDMDLHASTQMTLFSGAEANLFKSYGVTRYVPARELTIEEIWEARGQTDMEIEVFVHGALCYCYSGQCLMSECIGGRSGNRGMCAQPCRLPYRSKYGDGFLLSTKDICALMYIPELIEAGIDSFKIEGRMKKKEYSAYLSYLYRKYADIYRSEGKHAFKQLRENPDSELWKEYQYSMELYNRGGFSKGFLFEKDKSDIVYTKKNNHYGVLVGKVTDFLGGRAVFKLSRDIHYQDILEFRGKDDSQAYEYTVKEAAKAGESISANVMKGSRIYTGQGVYRTRNTLLLEKVNSQIDSVQDKFGIKGTFYGEQGRPARLTIEGKGIAVTTEGAVVQPASGRPVTEEDIRKRLGQLGNTDYVFNELDIVMAFGSFLPLGSLKQLRRQAVSEWEKKAAGRRNTATEHISEQRKDRDGEDKKSVEKEGEEREVLHVVSVASVSQLCAALSEAGEHTLFHLKLEDVLPEEWAEAASLLMGKRVALSFPGMLHGERKKKFERDWVKYGEVLRQSMVEAIFINSFSTYLYAKKWWQGATYYADENLYRKNRRAEEFYRGLGIRPAPDREYGRTPVMVTESCVAGTLGRCNKKRQNIQIATPKGDEFVVVNHCRYCYNTIYEQKPVRDRKSDRRNRLDFTTEQEDEVRKVIREWNF